MGEVLVPSDISLLEDKLMVKNRALTWIERISLMTMLPMWRIKHSKLDKHDLRKILSRDFGRLEAGDYSGELVRERQESVRKQVVARPFQFMGSGLAMGATWWSFRRYNYQSKAILLPFVALGGLYLGRVVGNIAVGRNQEFQRDRFLGSLPAHVYLR
jgi:hypothetical protein